MESFDVRVGRADRSANPELTIPTVCPTCQSTAIITTAKTPDSTSYWRCTKCGDVWNASRRAAGRPGRYQWP
jgi:predicted Zn finger-like uncharacterized protein